MNHHLSQTNMYRYPANAGIAIGPILFVIATLGLIAALISSNIGSYGTDSVIDRIAADIPSQANLIRTRLNQCNIQLASQLAMNNANKGEGFSSSCAPLTADNLSTCCLTETACAAVSSTYPNSSGAVSGLMCGSNSLWQGLSFPNPTNGFNAWNYVSNTTGGRCIYTTPTASNPVNNTGITQGLVLASKKFSTQNPESLNPLTPCTNSTNCTSEAIYDPASTSQKFVLWIAPPSAGSAPDPACLP